MLIYVVNNNGGYAIPFVDIGTITMDRRDLTGADLVVFTGGEDVDPSLYDAVPHPFTSSNLARDLVEKEIFEEALFYKIPMTGICRGSQFLHVMNGGKLHQHIEGHPAPHHKVVTEDGEVFVSNTLHHQAVCNQPEIGEVLAKSWPDNVVESTYYPQSRCLGVQYHPEMMDQTSKAVQWYKNKVRELMGLVVSDRDSLTAVH